jgi:hypothetical protein
LGQILSWRERTEPSLLSNPCPPLASARDRSAFHTARPSRATCHTLASAEFPTGKENHKPSAPTFLQEATSLLRKGLLMPQAASVSGPWAVLRHVMRQMILDKRPNISGWDDHWVCDDLEEKECGLGRGAARAPRGKGKGSTRAEGMLHYRVRETGSSRLRQVKCLLIKSISEVVLAKQSSD